MYSEELKETLNGLAYTSVWVNANGEHSFSPKEGWNEVSREDILGDINVGETAENDVKPTKSKKK